MKATPTSLTKVLGMNMLPPAVARNVKRVLSKSFAGITARQLKTFWKNLCCKQISIPENLREMVDHYIQTPQFREGSAIWNRLSREHIQLLVEKGFDNYQQTIARRSYWGEKFLTAAQIETLIQNCSAVSLDMPLAEVFKQYTFCNPVDSIQFHITDMLMLQYILDKGFEEILLTICRSEKDEIGSPVSIRYKDRIVTQELLNTTLELAFLQEWFELFPQTKTILEIGAGSGRTVRGFLRLNSELKVTIVDIPPALFLSQETLARQFPEKKIRRFSPDTTKESLEAAFEEFDLIFLTPDQAQLLYSNSIDLCLAIDCLHEMTPSTINYYFDLFDRIGRHLYFECWNEQAAITSRKVYGKFDYPTKPHWQKVFHDDCGVPNHYFHALYNIQADPLRTPSK